jgi:thiol-disulfide isomerase/thioredoxin
MTSWSRDSAVRSVRAHSLLFLALVACKRTSEPTPAPPPPTPVHDAALADAPVTTSWYRATVRAPDGIDAPFFLGVAPHEAIFKSGAHEVHTEATFDGKTLAAHLAIYQTAVDATVQPDGSLAGTFSATWVFGPSSIPLAATPVATPELAAPATAPLDLGDARTAWHLATSESGPAKLVIMQHAPGVFDASVTFDTGNILYIAGTGHDDTAVLAGFDATSGYRLELVFDHDRKHAKAKWFAGPRFDWRETATATRGGDFFLALKPGPARPAGKIGLPDLPAIKALPAGPLLVDISGSWCSTCRHAATFLHQLAKENEARGLRLVTLLYEFTEDPAANAKQVEAFKTTYGATWPVIAVPGTTDNFAATLPKGLKDVDIGAFPLLLFLAADRSLVAYHVGFPAEGSEGYKEATVEVRGYVDLLLGTR